MGVLLTEGSSMNIRYSKLVLAFLLFAMIGCGKQSDSPISSSRIFYNPWMMALLGIMIAFLLGYFITDLRRRTVWYRNRGLASIGVGVLPTVVCILFFHFQSPDIIVFAWVAFSLVSLKWMVMRRIFAPSRFSKKDKDH